MKLRIKNLVLLMFVFSLTIIGQRIVPLGSGSYNLDFPGLAKDGAGIPTNKQPLGTPRVSGNLVGKPIPTSDWWTPLIYTKSDGTDPLYSANFYNFIVGFRSDKTGLVIEKCQNTLMNDRAQTTMSAAKDFVVSVTGLSATSTVSDISDWFVTSTWDDGTHKLNATIGLGQPFIYFTKGASDVVSIFTQNNPADNVIDSEMIYIRALGTGKGDYAVYGPVGSTWTLNGLTYTSTLNNKTYFSVVSLPSGLKKEDGLALAKSWKKYAYVFPANTAASWSYDKATGKVRTDFVFTPDVKEGSGTTTLMGVQPHQWGHFAAGVVTPDTTIYRTNRGDLRVLPSNTFSIENVFRGVLPKLPEVAQYSSDFDVETLRSKLSAIQYDAMGDWEDTYNAGQLMNRLTQAARVADTYKMYDIRDNMLKTVQDYLETWFTAVPGKDKLTFQYREDWGIFIGFRSGYQADYDFNDRHFHWGYFLQAASAIAEFHPEWVASWGPMVDMLIRDASSPNRNDSKFPYLRNFCPMAGHSWANGFAQSPQGNDEESSSEAMNFYSALIYWGQLTNNPEITNMGIYMYTTELSSINEYWLDVNKRIFKNNPEYKFGITSQVYTSGYFFNSFFSTENITKYGIQLVPTHAGMLYLGYDNTQQQAYWADMLKNCPQYTSNVTGELGAHYWYDNFWGYQAMFNPSAALTHYKAFPNRVIKYGNSDAFTYFWLNSLNSLGKVDASFTADHPLAMVFDKGGDKTYVAHNYTTSPITVTFSDGYKLVVPARTTRSSKDLNVTATLTTSATSVAKNGTATLTATVVGAGVTKVEFYKGTTLLSTVNAAPYTYTTAPLAFGNHNFYAKVYSGSNYTISNTVSVLSGSVTPYGGVVPSIKAVGTTTLEAGKFDVFEGGNGSGITYAAPYYASQGFARTGETIDVFADATEGYVLGYIGAGLWINFTVNVEQAGIYDVSCRYVAAEPHGGLGGPLCYKLDGKQVSPSFSLPNTGTWDTNWSNWKSHTVSNVQLQQGKHVFTVLITGWSMNLGKLTFERKGDLPIVNPVAVVGADQSINLPTNSVSLDGSASTVGTPGSTLSYAWTQVSGPNTATLASSNSSIATASNLVLGTYVFKLTITESGTLKTDSKNTTITVNPVPVIPPTTVVNANKTINLPTTTSSVNGSSSNLGNGTNVTYAWVQKSGPSSATLATPSAVATNVSGLSVEGTWVFELTITTSNGSSKATTSITVVDPTKVPPTVVLPANYNVNLPVNTVLLDGSASTVAQGGIASFSWIQVSGPNSATIASPTANKTNVNGLIAGEYVFKLTVSDNNNPVRSSFALTTVKVIAPVVTCGATNIVGLNGSKFSWSASNDVQPTITFIGVNGSGTSYREIHYSVNGSDKGGYVMSGNTYTIPTNIVTTKAGDKIEIWFVYSAETGKGGNDQSNNAIQSFNVGDCIITSERPVIKDSDVSLYPNPATTSIFIEVASEIKFEQLVVLNTVGSVVENRVLSDENTLEVNISELKSGIYIVQLIGSNGTVVKKFVKK